MYNGYHLILIHFCIFSPFHFTFMSMCAITFNGGDNMSKLSARMPDGRMIYGAAAQQHIIKEDGGWDEHHRKFAERVADIALKELNNDLCRKNFKVLRGNMNVG